MNEKELKVKYILFALAVGYISFASIVHYQKWESVGDLITVALIALPLFLSVWHLFGSKAFSYTAAANIVLLVLLNGLITYEIIDEPNEEAIWATMFQVVYSWIIPICTLIILFVIRLVLKLLHRRASQ